MNFGDKIKLLRNEKGLTQPKLADKIGIEQSYLSKLENGKSFPSADNFDLILQAFQTDTEALLKGVDPTQIFKQLRQIPEVSRYLDKYHRQQKTQRKRWLVVSALFFILGFTSFLAGRLALVFPETFYNYYSEGIVLEGESLEIFFRWDETIRRQRNNSAGNEMEDLRLKMEQRRAEDFLLLTNYRGNSFNVPVAGGSRTYSLKSSENSERDENRLLVLIGVLFLALGIGGVVLERKFFN